MASHAVTVRWEDTTTYTAALTVTDEEVTAAGYPATPDGVWDYVAENLVPPETDDENVTEGDTSSVIEYVTVDGEDPPEGSELGNILSG